MADNKSLIVFGVIFLMILIGMIAGLQPSNVSHIREYEYADYINGTGFSADSGNNIAIIRDMNNGNWQGNEDVGIPWEIHIYFYNVTHFDAVESLHKYNSSTGTPSSHLIQRFIWCTIHNDWVALEEFTNEDFWYYHVKRIPDSEHFIYPNGTVILKYLHSANGNSAHDIWIDVCRLVSYENVIS